MSQPVLVRAAVLLSSAVTSLTAGTLVAPAASAGEIAPPPGLRSLPGNTAAALANVPLADPFGRKLR